MSLDKHADDSDKSLFFRTDTLPKDIKFYIHVRYMHNNIGLHQ